MFTFEFFKQECVLFQLFWHTNGDSAESQEFFRDLWFNGKLRAVAW